MPARSPRRTRLRAAAAPRGIAPARRAPARRRPVRRASVPHDSRAQAAPVAFEQAPELWPRGERDEEVAGGMSEVERHASREHGRECRPRVRIEAEPEPEIHERAEAYAENGAEERERDAAVDRTPGKRTGEPTPGPTDHLPRRPRPLAEEEIRHD